MLVAEHRIAAYLAADVLAPDLIRSVFRMDAELVEALGDTLEIRYLAPFRIWIVMYQRTNRHRPKQYASVVFHAAATIQRAVLDIR